MRYDRKNAPTFDPSATIPASRSYQLELLEESLSRNIIIALDTGSGKTHIAVLRIKTEVLERETRKVLTSPEKILVADVTDVVSYSWRGSSRPQLPSWNSREMSSQPRYPYPSDWSQAHPILTNGRTPQCGGKSSTLTVLWLPPRKYF